MTPLYCLCTAFREQLTGRQMRRYDDQAHRSQGAYFYGDLWKYLYSGLPQGSVQFGHEVTDLLGEEGDPLRPTVNGQRYDTVIVADGGWSRLRPLVTGDDQGQPEYAGHVIYRAKCSLQGFEADYGAFVGEGIYTVKKVLVFRGIPCSILVNLVPFLCDWICGI